MQNTTKNQVSHAELEVLRVLHERLDIRTAESPTAEIAEISATSGIRDNDEILRALYTLEGKNLVSPEPPGDLTSHLWKITDTGVKALRVLSA